MPRDTLSSEQIVQAAISILDAEGLEGFSMRNLGSHLDSAATAVYWHVKSKDNLIILAGDEVWKEISLPDPSEVGWRSAITTMAKEIYLMVVSHPWLMSAMSTYLIYGPGKARVDDHTIAIYEAAGFAGNQADIAATTVLMFVLGAAIGEASDRTRKVRMRREGIDEDVEAQRLMASAREIFEQYPRLGTRLETVKEEDLAAVPEESLDLGLQAILDGLQAQLTS